MIFLTSRNCSFCLTCLVFLPVIFGCGGRYDNEATRVERDLRQEFSNAKQLIITVFDVSVASQSTRPQPVTYQIQDESHIKELGQCMRISSIEVVGKGIHPSASFRTEVLFRNDRAIYVVGGSNGIAFYPDFLAYRGLDRSYKMAVTDGVFRDELVKLIGAVRLDQDIYDMRWRQKGNGGELKR